MRWLDWGARSYHDFALGLALLLIAAAILQSKGVPQPIAYLMGLSGLTYLVQGWVVAEVSREPTRS
jgi:cytochrome bd-type quinol oxidase subunit 1